MDGGQTHKTLNITAATPLECLKSARLALLNMTVTKGFNQGSVTLKYRDYTMTQDRGRTFQLDSMDINESNFIANAGNVMGTFQKEWVIPEIDSYRYSRIAALAKADGRVLEGYTLDSDTILEKLDEEITNIQDVAGEKRSAGNHHVHEVPSNPKQRQRH